MSGMMNGAPFWSPPHRHQKSYISRLCASTESTLNPELAEFPALVADAIRKGLIKRPDPKDLVPVPIVKRGPLAPWQTAECLECQCTFKRNRRNIVKCETCRIPIKACKNCQIEFRPVDRKKVCCSRECSQKMQIASFRAQHTYSKTLPKMAECIVCRQIKPVRPSGSGVAKTCSPECSAAFRKIRSTETNQRTK